MRPIHAGAVVCAVMMLAGCGSDTEEGAGPSTGVETTTQSAPPPVTTTAAPATPTLVPAAAGADLLLKRSELGEIIGDTDLVELGTLTKWERQDVNIEPWPCRARALAGEEGLSGDTITLAGNVNRGARKQSVDQVVAIFEKPTEITASTGVMWIIEEQWRDCPDGDIFFIEVEGKDQRWVPYPITTGPDRIGTTFQRDGLPRNCHHVVAHRANVLADVIVCGDGDNTAPANTVADRILAKVPE
ncbi:sensor domain-containing protein [Mycobacterium sp. NPDC051804]|uniref:sensor domain-containing protein n=1 Tax=Mycobacterium sp. NPDC051804 TaxID=3364295 RepID=UPI003799BA19